MDDSEIPRPVKPRKPHDANKPIIAIHNGRVYIERTDTVASTDDLAAIVASEPSSYIVAHNAGIVLAGLHKTYGYHPLWQYKLTPIEREVRKDDGSSFATVRTVIVNFFGFASPSKGRRGRKSHYHYPLDPLVFVRKSAPEIRGRELDPLEALYDWACDVRSFAVANGLRVSPTSGGIAAQLLRDERFYPEDRRKVPAATNARARAVLPGNFYRLSGDTEKFYRAVYLDQDSAHHNCAKDILFPHADRLFAKGWFDRDGCNGCNGYWSKPGTKHFAKIISQPGLFYLRLQVPRPHRGQTVPPYMEEPGQHDAWVYSNELPMIEKLGGKILGLYAAWTSTVPDDGLNKYAEWALKELDSQPKETKEWLKPTLLSTYGVLAATPREMETYFLRATSGEPVQVPVGPELLPARHRATSKKVEPGFANVIHRGMIEAETRRRTIELANELDESGLEVIAVYADSVFVRRNGPLPLLPAGWSVKHDLDGLRFLNAVSFTSRQLVKLPGVPRELQDRYLASSIHRKVENRPPVKVPSDRGSSLLGVGINQTRKGET